MPPSSEPPTDTFDTSGTSDTSDPAGAASTLIDGFDQPLHALVVGASGGIGHALAQRLAEHPQVARLFLASRTACRHPALAVLQARHPDRITLLDCDLRDDASLAVMAETIRSAVPQLHLVINTAGMLHDGTLQPEKALTQVTLAGLQAAFAINAFGPILLAKALLPLLRHGAPAVFASLSARVGSIGDNRIGGWYSYRAAKAAQNQLLRTLAIELTRMNRQSIVLALHPGTTDTGLSKPFQSNVATGKLFTPEFVADALLRVIAARTPADSGGFYAWDGAPVPW